MQKVIVIGCSGSGKTTFCLALKKATNLPLIHLDFAHHQNIWDRNPVKAKIQKQNHIQRLLQEPEWIIDGNYQRTLHMRAEAADTIIFLDYPWWLCMWRALKRRWMYRNAQRPDMPTTWKEKISWELLKEILTYQKNRRPRILEILNKLKSKKRVIVFHNSDEANSFIESMR